MKVLVLGDFMLDIYHWGTSNRIAPEAPVPVVKIYNETYELGAACNVAQSLSQLGLEVYIAGIIGQDNNGKITLDILHKSKINTDVVLLDDRKTTTKHRIIVEDKIVSRYDIEDIDPISCDQEDILYNKILTMININDIQTIVISDYLKGVCTKRLLKMLIDLSNAISIKLYTDPKDVDYTKYQNFYFVKPNRKEAELMLKEPIIPTDIQKIDKLYNLLKCEILMITFGELGLCIKTSLSLYYIPINNPQKVINVTGAGDSVLAGFVYFYMHTDDLYKSACFANFCGQTKVSKPGTYSLKMNDLLVYKKSLLVNKKLITKEIGVEICNLLREINHTIVFTNGCFDILHYGHLSYLEKSKNLGDVLIVGLNTDEYIRKNKGINRPIHNIQQRIQQLKALYFVDYIIVFEEDDPTDLLKSLSPDILTKGGDYTLETIKGNKYAKKTIIIDYIPDISTTSIIDKMN